MRRSRRAFLAAAFLLGIFVSASMASAQTSDAKPLKKVALLLDWYPQAEQGGYFYALINGLYKKAGLDVDLIPFAPNVAGEGQVAVGKVQFMWNTSNQIMTARARGLPIVAVMSAMQHDPKGILIHDESPVHTFEDLDGHAVAVAPGSAWFTYIIKKYHLTHVQERPLVMNNALFLHDTNYFQECFVTAEPYAIEKSGQKVRTLLIQDSGFDPYRVVATSESYLANNKETVKAFVDASIAGWKGYLNDPAATDAEIIRRNPEMSQGQLDYSVKKMKEDHFIDGDAAKGEAIGQINMTRVAQQYEILRSLGVIPSFDYAKAFDNEFCAPGAKASP